MASTSSYWGSGYNKFGQTRYPSGALTRGTIFRGSAPAVNKFRAPDAGVSPNFSGPSGPIINQQSNGIINRTINTLAAGGVAMKDENIRARRQRRQSGIDQAKVQLKINNIRNQRAQAGQALLNAYQQATRPQPVNPYASAWNNSPNNPQAPWQVKPPTGAPPTPTSPPLSNTGVPALPPPKTTRGAGSTSSPFDLSPLAEMGGDFITQSMRNMSDDDTSPAPTSVEWKDEPTNPFPSGPVKPFDSSRMFDPTYKSTEEMSKPASSRTKKRPPK
jgi:hypothetical protein